MWLKGGTGKLKFVSTELTYFFFGIKFVAVKKIGKELGNNDHNNKWTVRWTDLILLFIRQNQNLGIYTHSFRVKYVVCSPTKVFLYLIELLPSTVWRSFPSLAAKKIYEELDINNSLQAEPLCTVHILCAIKDKAKKGSARRVRCINNVYTLNKLDYSVYIFRSAKSQRRHWRIGL